MGSGWEPVDNSYNSKSFKHVHVNDLTITQSSIAFMAGTEFSTNLVFISIWPITDHLFTGQWNSDCQWGNSSPAGQFRRLSVILSKHIPWMEHGHIKQLLFVFIVGSTFCLRKIPPSDNKVLFTMMSLAHKMLLIALLRSSETTAYTQQFPSTISQANRLMAIHICLV